MPSPTLRLSPSLSPSPHPTDGGSKTYQSSGMGASDHLHQVSKITCNISHQTQGMGGREQHFLCTLIPTLLLTSLCWAHWELSSAS